MVPKFRAWLESVEEMVEVLDIDFYDKKVGYIWSVQVSDYEREQSREADKFDELILMQYTGHKDKHGKDIYIGDILEDKYQRIYRVDVCWRCELVNSALRTSREIGPDLEIIGNAYENPDLLDGSYM